jgi:hypothetical protein
LLWREGILSEFMNRDDQGLRRAKLAARGRFAASKGLKTDRLIRAQRSSLAAGEARQPRARLTASADPAGVGAVSRRRRPALAR